MAQLLGEDEEDPPDPFSRSRSIHPALGDPHYISSDIFTPLFDGSLHNEIFHRWLHRMKSWQLHFLGGPGAGKTTITALIADRIRTNYADSLGLTTHSASIFIHNFPIKNELAFLEDFLDDVYRQLTPIGLITCQSVLQKYEKYTEAQNTGKRISARVNLIGQALQQRIAEIEEMGRAFLVIDNIDQCSPTLGELLLRELSILQHCGLGIAITSRLPQYGSLRDVYCDIHELGPFEGRLAFYRYCSTCEKTFVCDSCDRSELQCNKCGDDTHWVEPDHLELAIDSIYQRRIESFIAWDLEREHGDLGLGSDVKNYPPLSSFGIAFRRDKPEHTGRDWVRTVAQSVNGSVVQAKLALDRIHVAPSPNAINFSPNRIPENVQVLFHTAIKSIGQQPSSQRELALRSLAAVGKEGGQDMGLPLTRLAGLLKARSHKPSASDIPPRSTEDILASAKGYLTLMPPYPGEAEFTIVTFNRMLFRYINEDYNDELVMANSQLRTSKIPTSFTRALQSPITNEPEPSWQDRVADLKRFQSPKLSSWSARGSPPITRQSPGSNRSMSFNMSGAPMSTSPAPGLGLGVELEGNECKENYMTLTKSHLTQEETQALERVDIS